MRDPEPNEEYVIVVDNKGRQSIQYVEYIVTDVRGETIYVTTDGLTYASDSLSYKGQDDLLEVFDRIPTILAHPEIVVRDYQSPSDTLLYYKRVYIPAQAQHWLLCVVIKVQKYARYLYNFFEQQSGKVKGYQEVPPPSIWYIAPKKRPRNYGLSSR
jgi:hypothetical protein